MSEPGSVTIHVEVWLYGPLARFAGEQSRGSYAQLHLELPHGTNVGQLLARLGIPVDEKGMSFVNGNLTGMPGLPADLEFPLGDGDRVGIFHKRSMWPFQYRFGASVSDKLKEAMQRDDGGGLFHSSPARSAEKD